MIADHACQRPCTRCGTSHSEEHFFRDPRNKSGRSSHCRACHADASRRWQARNRDRMNATRRAHRARNREEINAKSRANYNSEAIRWRNISRLYRLSRDEYEAILALQGGVCALCGAGPGKRALAVDHDHSCCPSAPTCGRCTRGLLCGTCNTSLHAIEAKAGWLERATSYIKGERA